MTMNSYFLVALGMMIVTAIAFLMQPLWRPDFARSKNSRAPYFAVALLVPTLAVALYANLGRPQLAAASTEIPRMTATMSASVNGRAQQTNLDSVANLVAGLASRLAENPDDAGGWLLLAKSYKHVGEREAAIAAYERAVSLGRNDPDLDAYISSADSGQSDELKSAGIQGRVTIANELVADVDGSATVFVIAKAAQGSPVPLAVLRTTVSTLPFDFNLHDGQAMVAGNNLSSAETVIVTAKVSADGDAMSTVPGLEINSDPIRTAQPEFVSLHLGH